ncbi:MAG TPA: alpha/beta hydrolase [Alphaproteobacteria bacterium]
MRSVFHAYLPAFALLTLAAAPAAAELVKLQPRPGVELRIAIEAAPNAAAYALIFAGGHGKLQLDEGGQPRGLRGNFLVRARNHLAARGIGIVLVDAPSDSQGAEGLWPVRVSPSHAADIGQVVRHIRQRFNRPVWVVGTSAGTLSAAAVAAYLRGADRPDGIVFTSSITARTRRIRQTALDVNLAAYTGAVLIAAHDGDACIATPPSGAQQLFAALAGARPKKLQMFTGGSTPRSDPCEAFAQHGFLGIEAQVMSAIADFMRRPSN